MYNFRSDYTEGAHPDILTALLQVNLTQENGYGEDQYSVAAKNRIRERLQNPVASIYLVSGGTQANLLVISSLLKMHEAVISAASGHIFTHETGAIEATGHRVITVEGFQGKIRPQDLEPVLEQYSMRPHMVKPRLVYISNSTEIGTVYQYAELQALHGYCSAHGLLLYMDGARLGQAIVSAESDLKFQDLSVLTDVFYIGGTKNGALLGEAIVFNNPDYAGDFDYILKQRGALLAKGRVLGVQFLELFRHDLFFELAAHANQQARRIADCLAAKGIAFLTPTQTNQIFPILSEVVVGELRKKYDFYTWRNLGDGQVAIRVITSWATAPQAVDNLIADFENMLS